MDLGANSGQNYPLITSAPIASNTVTISGTLNSTASTTFRVELFSNAACDPSGNGEGQTPLGFTNVTTDATCNGTLGPIVLPVAPGQMIFTATATSPTNNTSEFSPCFPVAGGVTPTATRTPTLTPPGPTVTPTVTPTLAGPPPTPTTPRGAVNVRTLSPVGFALLGLALAAAALLLLKRS